MKPWGKMGALGIGTALLIILCMDGFLFMGQMAVADITIEMGGGGAGNQTIFYHYENSFISKFDKGNYTISTNKSMDELLGTDASVDPETGNIFTDTFAKVKNWFTGIGAGIGIFLEVLGGPYRFVVMTGAPQWFSYTIGAIWYGLTIFLFVAFIAGRTPD